MKALLFAFLAAAGFCAQPALAAEPLTVAGATLDVPAGWMRVGGAEAAENFSETLRVDDQAFQAQLEQAVRRTDLTLVRTLNPEDAINPTVRFSVRPIPAIEGDVPRLVLDEAITVMRRTFGEIGPGEVRPISLGGAVGYEFSATFVMPTNAGPLPVRARTVVLRRGAKLFIIGVSMSQTEPGQIVAEADAIIASLRVAEAG